MVSIMREPLNGGKKSVLMGGSGIWVKKGRCREGGGGLNN